jgi:hypothetical protein
LGAGTFVLAVVTAFLARFTRQTAKAMRIAERAYIKISHTGPLRLAASGLGVVPMVIDNRGRTPAHITDVRVAHEVAEALSEKPVYGPKSLVVGNGRLVGRMHFSFDAPIIITPGEFDAIKQGIKNLYLIGYADYTELLSAQKSRGICEAFRARRRRRRQQSLFRQPLGGIRVRPAAKETRMVMAGLRPYRSHPLSLPC